MMISSAIRRHSFPAARSLVLSPVSYFSSNVNGILSQRLQSTGNRNMYAIKEWKPFKGLRAKHTELRLKSNDAKEFDKFAALGRNERASYVLDLETSCSKHRKTMRPVQFPIVMTDAKKAKKMKKEREAERRLDNGAPTTRGSMRPLRRSGSRSRAKHAEWNARSDDARKFDKFEAMDQNGRASYALDLESSWEHHDNHSPEEYFATDEKRDKIRAEHVKKRSDEENKHKYATIEEEWKSFEHLRAKHAEWHARSDDARQFDKFEAMDQNGRASYVLDLESSWEHYDNHSPEGYFSIDEKRDKIRAEQVRKRSDENKHKYATIEEEWKSFEHLRAEKAEWLESFFLICVPLPPPQGGDPKTNKRT